MTTTTIGNIELFAIEYALTLPDPPNGHIRIWAGGEWFGDITRSMFLYQAATSLKAQMERDPRVLRRLYSSEFDAPRDDLLLSQTSLSWGDSFDDFLFYIYQ